MEKRIQRQPHLAIHDANRNVTTERMDRKIEAMIAHDPHDGLTDAGRDYHQIAPGARTARRMFGKTIIGGAPGLAHLRPDLAKFDRLQAQQRIGNFVDSGSEPFGERVTVIDHRPLAGKGIAPQSYFAGLARDRHAAIFDIGMAFVFAKPDDPVLMVDTLREHGIGTRAPEQGDDEPGLVEREADPADQPSFGRRVHQ